MAIHNRKNEKEALENIIKYSQDLQNTINKHGETAQADFSNDIEFQGFVLMTIQKIGENLKSVDEKIRRKHSDIPFKG